MCTYPCYFLLYVLFSCSVVSESLRPHEPQHARSPCPSPTPESTQTHVHWVDDANQPPHPLSSPSPPALNLSQQQGLFQWVSSSHQVAKSIGVSASTSVLPMNTQDWSLGWTGWISLQPKGLWSLLQHHSSKASILQCSAFFTVQLSHPYMTTGKIIVLTRQTFVDKVMYLLSTMLSRLLITFFPRSKRLLISWLQSPPTVVLEPRKIKSDTVSTVSPFTCNEVIGPDAMMLVFWISLLWVNPKIIYYLLDRGRVPCYYYLAFSHLIFALHSLLCTLSTLRL